MTTTQGGQTLTLAGNIGYVPFGTMSGLVYGNNLVHSRSYDLDYRLTELITSGRHALSYTLDAANNITMMANNLDVNRSQSFFYDELNRLAEATGNYGDMTAMDGGNADNAGAVVSATYTYDAIGNRLSRTVDTDAEDYTYDTGSHHLLQTQNGGIKDYTYDANGNMTSNADRDFSYGDNNRLQEVSIGGSTLATYTYNGRGERVKKDAATITYYHYDQGGQLIAETDAVGNIIREYVYVNGQPLALIEVSGINYIHTDHLGTPQVITDDTQTVVWQADYDPFGKANITTEMITNNLRFPGQYYDQETNLHYNYFRDYDPTTGRYIESDPIGLGGGMNNYLYTNANPIKNIDPSGLVCFELFRLPVDFKSSNNKRWSEWGMWQFSNMHLEGGEGIPFWVVRCICTRSRSGQQTTNRGIKWLVVDLCSDCGGPNNGLRQRYVWENLNPKIKNISETDSKILAGGFHFNEVTASLACEGKCNTLNR